VCGPGAISVGLADAVGPAGHVTGVDFGESQIQAAKARATPNLTLHYISGRLHSVRASLGERHRGEGIEAKQPTEGSEGFIARECFVRARQP
jgi:tRNA A58 N-methylase Trm61